MTRRKRRTPKEAKEAILNAAEAHLIKGGSARIRLQEVAKDAGISHPTLLHHIGSRDALIQAVADRAFQSLQLSVVKAIIESSAKQTGLAPIIEQLFQVLHKSGYGRALAWLILEHADQPHDALSLATIIEAAHTAKTAACERDGLPLPDKQETTFAVLLTTFALFAHSFAGEAAFESAGASGLGAEFRQWLSELLEARFSKT